jgi:hypothetical protein
VLAPLAASVHNAVGRAACSRCLGAALVLAPPASAMRDAVERAALSGLGAAFVLAAPAASMSLAVPRAFSRTTYRNRLPVNSFLTLENSNSGHHTHDGGSARAGQTLQHVSVKDGQERLGGGRTVGV